MTTDDDLIQPDNSGGRDAAGRWTAGTSGNPDGRPVGRGSITTELRRLLAETDGDGVPLHERIARRLLALAEGGDLRAIREVLDRVDGTPTQGDKHQGEPIEFAPIVLRPITFEKRD